MSVIVAFGDLDAEQAIEGPRPVEIRGDDPKCVQLRHEPDANR